MVARITEGVKVIVNTEFQPDYSNPAQAHFVFTYRIVIENNSHYTVQLIRRHWIIADSFGERKEVVGDGVVGQQPILEPGESHEYISGCNLKSGIGKMVGTYTMRRIVDSQQFLVNIPEFSLVVPWRNN
jgi:ApaG protein